MRICTVDGCERKHEARGLCRTHYSRARVGAPLDVPVQVHHEACTVDGCSAKHEGHGYCAKHYQRWKKYGSPDSTTLTYGKQESVGYAGAHIRVRKARGPAKDHRCIFCGCPAQEWAYDHSDPNEQVGMTGGRSAAFSLDVERYLPLCIPCHRAYDAGAKR